MKNFVKQMVMAAAVLLIAAPAIAAGGPTKGTKSYQDARSEKTATEQTTDTAQAEDLSQIAPAAGDATPMEDKAASGKKSFREEMRLPRKN